MRIFNTTILTNLRPCISTYKINKMVVMMMMMMMREEEEEEEKY
jgi:hypothetical protein